MNHAPEAPSSSPEISVSAPNRRLANLLGQDLAGPVSEMTSVHQYVYQSWIFSKAYPDISKTLEKISIAEMHHFNTLGRLIYLLGGSPQCRSIQQNRQIIWHGGMINYTVVIKQALTTDLKGEQLAYQNYLRKAKETSDPKVSQILNRLAEEERQHIETFETMLKQL